MKHCIWLMYCTAGLAVTDAQRPFTAPEQDQESALNHQDINNHNGSSSSQRIRSHSSATQNASLRRKDASQLQTLSSSRAAGQDSQHFGTVQFSKSDMPHKKNLPFQRKAESVEDSSTPQVQRQSSEPRAIDASSQSVGLASDNGDHADRLNRNSRQDYFNTPTLIMKAEHLEHQSPKTSPGRSSMSEKSERPLSIEEKRLHGRGVLLPRTKPAKATKATEAAKDKTASSSGTSSPSRSSDKPSLVYGVRSRSPVHGFKGKDLSHLIKPDHLVAQAGIQIQGEGVAHTIVPDKGVHYFPSTGHIPTYRKAEHHDTVTAGGKIYHDPSGRLSSMAVHAEGRHVNLHMEPERHSTGYYEVNLKGTPQGQRYILQHGTSTKKHFGGNDQPHKVRVVGTLVGPGFMTLSANNRGSGDPKKLP